MGRKASAARRTPPETRPQSAKSLEEWYDHWLEQVEQNGDFVERIVEQLLLRTEYERIMEIITKLIRE